MWQVDERMRVLQELRALKARHEGATAEAGAEGFIEDEMVTRESYHVVARGAISAGVLSEEELAFEGLGVLLDE